MNIIQPDVPFNPMALADAIDKITVHTVIPDARFMPSPLDNEYALLKYRLAHMGYTLKPLCLLVLEILVGVTGEEMRHE